MTQQALEYLLPLRRDEWTQQERPQALKILLESKVITEDCLLDRKLERYLPLYYWLIIFVGRSFSELVHSSVPPPSPSKC